MTSDKPARPSPKGVIRRAKRYAQPEAVDDPLTELSLGTAMARLCRHRCHMHARRPSGAMSSSSTSARDPSDFPPMVLNLKTSGRK
jgi:hypothetical protein